MMVGTKKGMREDNAKFSCFVIFWLSAEFLGMEGTFLTWGCCALRADCPMITERSVALDEDAEGGIVWVSRG